MNVNHTNNDRTKRGRQVSEEELAQIQTALGGLQFGSVQITVQDGVIVQIDRTEKRRLRIPHSNGKE